MSNLIGPSRTYIFPVRSYWTACAVAAVAKKTKNFATYILRGVLFHTFVQEKHFSYAQFTLGHVQWIHPSLRRRREREGIVLLPLNLLFLCSEDTTEIEQSGPIHSTPCFR